MQKLFSILLFNLFLCCVLLISCSSKNNPPPDNLLPADLNVVVAPFSQPVNTGELIAGRIPENQGRISMSMLDQLDADFRQLLVAEKKRHYIFAPNPVLNTNIRTSAQPRGLEYWLNYGREHSAKLLLVPQVLDWHEREGSKIGVTQSAHVRLEFFLIQPEQEIILKRSVYEEKQVGLIDDLLTIKEFVQRRGTWVSASELSLDGMRKAVTELGL